MTRAPIYHRCIVGATLLGMVGCPSPSPTSDSAATAAESQTWHRRGRTLDLTGDGRPDSVHLEAHGSRADSLRIAVELIVNGAVKHREEWGSSYELAVRDSSVRLQPRLDEFMRARLDTVLANVVVQALDHPSVRLMAEDSVVLAGLVPRPRYRVTLQYGYETTARFVWDAPRERFVRLWTCC